MRQRISGYECFKLFMKVKNHFSSDNFDVFKSSIRFPESSFEKRHDKGLYNSLAYDYAKGDLAYYFMANITAGNSHPSEMTDICYREWKSRMHSIDRNVEIDCKTISDIMAQHSATFKEAFTSSGGIPIAMQMVNGGLIKKETMCVLDMALDGRLIEVMTDQVKDTFVWPDLKRSVVKYSPFLIRYYKKPKTVETLKQYLRN